MKKKKKTPKEKTKKGQKRKKDVRGKSEKDEVKGSEYKRSSSYVEITREEGGALWPRISGPQIKLGATFTARISAAVPNTHSERRLPNELGSKVDWPQLGRISFTSTVIMGSVPITCMVQVWSEFI